MKKILVTADLSANSKAGIRFAIQLAKQAGSTLIFYNGVEINKPTRWSPTRFDNYLKSEINFANEHLKRFINDLYKEVGIEPGNYLVVVERISSLRDAIVNYSVANKIDFICMATRGAGKLKRLIGSNTSAVLTSSPVPVFAIPGNYKATAINAILYASDLAALSTELTKVKRIAALLDAKIDVLHFTGQYESEEVRAKFDKTASSLETPGIKFHLEKLGESLSANLQKAEKKFDPAVVVLFTKQNRDWYERIFSPSKSAAASFVSKKPLLIYAKKS